MAYLRQICFTLIFIFSLVAHGKTLSLLPPKTYSSLSEISQTVYTNQIRQAWIQFESEYPKAGEIGEQVFWQQFIFSEAFASSTNKTCVIGGATVPTASSKNGRVLCSTRTRPCGNLNYDGYLCGSVFSSACVSRTPVNGISSRCVKPGKPLTPPQYRAAHTELTDNYKKLCGSDAEANTQESCNKLAEKTSEITASTKTSSSANFAPIKGTCAYGVDPATGHALQIAQFGLTEDFSCLYKRNQEQLAKIATTGCDGGSNQVGNELFVTRIRSQNNNFLFGTGNVFDSIIEEVTVQEQKNPSDVTYNLQMLKPSSTSPVVLERKNMLVHFSGGQYYLCLPDCATKQEPIQIGNAVRSNILPEHLTAPSQSAMDALIDGKVMLAKNCRLSGQLKNLNLYQNSQQPNRPASSSKAGGTH